MDKLGVKERSSSLQGMPTVGDSIYNLIDASISILDALDKDPLERQKFLTQTRAI